MTNLHHPSIVRYSTSWVEFEADFEKMKEFYQKQLDNSSIKASGFKALANEPFNDVSFKENDSPTSPKVTIINQVVNKINFAER